MSGLMTRGHEHKCTWVETEKINSTLEEWIALGWELVTAYCGPSSTVTRDFCSAMSPTSVPAQMRCTVVCAAQPPRPRDRLISPPRETAQSPLGETASAAASAGHALLVALGRIEGLAV